MAAALVDGGVVRAVALRPDLWPTAIGVVRRFARRGWWRRPPFLPLPATELWRFRMVTAYGDPDARPAPADALDYLEWCREVATADRRARRASAWPSTARPRTVSRRQLGEDG